MDILEKFKNYEKSGILPKKRKNRVRMPNGRYFDIKKLRYIIFIHAINERRKILPHSIDISFELINLIILELNEFLTQQDFDLISKNPLIFLHLANHILPFREQVRTYGKLFNEINIFHEESKKKKLRLENLKISKLELKFYINLGKRIYLPTTTSFIQIYLRELFGINNKKDPVIKITKVYLHMFLILGRKSFLPSIVALSCIYLTYKSLNINNINNHELLFYLSISTEYKRIQILYCSYIISKTFSVKERYSISDNFSIKQFLLQIFKENSKILGGKETIYIEKKYSIDNIDIDTSDILYLDRPEYRFQNHVEENKLEIFDKIGEGVYGEVFKVNYNGQIKALKKFVCENILSNSNITEITLLNLLSHPNIINLDSVNISFENKNICLSIVMELMEENLSNYINQNNLNIESVKKYSLQLLNAIKYINDLGIIHGDIKPENILIKNDNIKLADFGISIPYVIDKRSGEVYTVPYRPIELLIKSDKLYSYEVEVWACGVVIAEMILGQRLFFIHEIFNIDQFNYIDESHHDTLEIIYELFDFHPEYNIIKKIKMFLGTDKILENDIGNDMKKYNKDIISYIDEIKDELNNEHIEISKILLDYFNLDHYYNVPNYEEYFNIDDELLIDLILGMINVPENRLTIEECINHPWFFS